MSTFIGDKYRQSGGYEFKEKEGTIKLVSLYLKWMMANIKIPLDTKSTFNFKMSI